MCNPSRARSKYPSRSRLNPPESALDQLAETRDDGYDDSSKGAQHGDYRQPEKQFLHDIQLDRIDEHTSEHRLTYRPKHTVAASSFHKLYPPSL